MLIIDITYKVDIDKIEKHLQKHIEFLDKYYKKEIFIFSGRKKPRTGGIILAQKKDNIEIENIIKEDPFYKNDLATYKITEFTITKNIEFLNDILKSN